MDLPYYRVLGHSPNSHTPNANSYVNVSGLSSGVEDDRDRNPAATLKAIVKKPAPIRKNHTVLLGSPTRVKSKAKKQQAM